MIDEMSDLVHGNLVIVIGRWEQISCYMESLLAEKNGLLDPEYHDSLLTDDAKFTRSKKYFWAIEFFIEAETSVLDNINQARRFVELMNSNPPSEEVARRIFVMRLRKHNTAIQKLDSLRKGFVKKQEEAKALRDGVSRFHHSGQRG
jgi:SpoVK/Ycf46/Vps4 family AAA+-type ATPase